MTSWKEVALVLLAKSVCVCACASSVSCRSWQRGVRIRSWVLTMTVVPVIVAARSGVRHVKNFCKVSSAWVHEVYFSTTTYYNPYPLRVVTSVMLHVVSIQHLDQPSKECVPMVRWQATRALNPPPDAPEGFHAAVEAIQEQPPPPVDVEHKKKGWSGQRPYLVRLG